jgi:hypothetical protein
MTWVLAVFGWLMVAGNGWCLIASGIAAARSEVLILAICGTVGGCLIQMAVVSNWGGALMGVRRRVRGWRGEPLIEEFRTGVCVQILPVDAALVRPCSICYTEEAAGEPVLQLPCRHIYHAECMRRWLRDHCECPYCRQDARRGPRLRLRCHFRWISRATTMVIVKSSGRDD